MFYRSGAMADRSFTLRECSCHLDLDPMTFIYELDLNSFEIYEICKNELPVRHGFRKLSSDRQRDRDTITDATEIIYHSALGVVNNKTNNQSINQFNNSNKSSIKLW